jgi:hypothetical protein
MSFGGLTVLRTATVCANLLRSAGWLILLVAFHAVGLLQLLLSCCLTHMLTLQLLLQLLLNLLLLWLRIGVLLLRLLLLVRLPLRWRLALLHVLESKASANQTDGSIYTSGWDRSQSAPGIQLQIQHAKTGRQTSKLRLVACTQSEVGGCLGGRHCEWVRWLRGCSGLAVVCCWWLKFEPRDDAGQDPNFEQEHK